ncbi:MAG TPA: biotin/lipoyl-binding protein, partial [Allosphingosinicella sp.]
MSVIRIPKAEAEPRLQSGGAMDRVVETKGLSKQVKIAIGVGLVLIAALIFYLMAPSASSQTVAADRVTISTVQKGRFDDFLPLRARVTPLVTVFLDAVEGGRVEQVLVEDGAMVQKGQLLAVLSNSEIQLNLLRSQSDVSREVNSMRSQELALAQTSIQDERAVIDAQLAADKAKRQFETQKPLMEKGFVPAKVFNDSRDEYLSMQRRAEVLRRARAINQRLQTSQLAELRASNASLSGSLDIARSTLDALNLRAPVAGQLTAFSIQVGQSLNRGERLGQIDSAGRSKLVAQVDEFYLGRVEPGQIATAE